MEPAPSASAAALVAEALKRAQTVGDFLRVLIAAKQPVKTQRDLAEMLNVDAAQVSRWLSRRDRVGYEHLAKLSEIFGVNEEQLRQLWIEEVSRR